MTVAAPVTQELSFLSASVPPFSSNINATVLIIDAPAPPAPYPRVFILSFVDDDVVFHAV